ncbi:MAG: helix-turn-helix domain-containing protein [Asgard group archaeon]|nr:helix-turn-helix domain-containing protein [Asgard group archaeon]
MIKKVLEYLKSKDGNSSISAIAKNLEIDKGTIVLILHQLEELGYLEKIKPIEELSDDCKPLKCANCPKAKDCEPINHIRYKLIKKNNS